MTFRERVVATDVDAVRALVKSTGMFRPDEAAIAVELVEDGFAKGDRSDYHFLFADAAAGGLAGYICYGVVPCTIGTWDLYWIAVDPALQGQGLGRRLVDALEAKLRAEAGRLVTVDTSGRADYAPTRGFYDRVGYTIAATFPDFYAPGDAKVVFTKRLAP